MLTPRLGAEIATNRFCDHQPYYRQEQHFLMRHGVHLPRNTMSQWMADLSDDYLSGIYRSMHEEILSEKYLQVDETPIEYLDPGGGKTSQGYLWTLSCPDQKTTDGRGDILYQWHASRAATCLESLLQTPRKSFCGILQCDGYQAYETYRNRREDIDLIVSVSPTGLEWCPAWRGPLWGGTRRIGTATDYRCCVTAMDAGGVTARPLLKLA